MYLREVIWKLKLTFLRVLLCELGSMDDLENFMEIFAVSLVKINSFEILHEFFFENCHVINSRELNDFGQNNDNDE